jgi:hypothetical protein
MSEKILEEANKASNSNFPENKYHSATLIDKIHKLFMPAFPLWSNVLIGNLSRHGADEVYSCLPGNITVIRGNTAIEKRFQVL